MSAAMAYALIRPARLSLEAFATRAELHPDLIRRFTALGLLEADRDAAGRLSFAPAQLLRVGRIKRLRAGLSLNYAAIGLVMDLLDRVSALEAELRAARRTPVSGPVPRSRSTWT